jgi:hypothetical protein
VFAIKISPAMCTVAYVLDAPQEIEQA